VDLKRGGNLSAMTMKEGKVPTKGGLLGGERHIESQPEKGGAIPGKMLWGTLRKKVKGLDSIKKRRCFHKKNV